jgi:hypothetical protein
MTTHRRTALYTITFAVWLIAVTLLIAFEHDGDVSMGEQTALLLWLTLVVISSVSSVIVAILCPMAAMFTAGFKACQRIDQDEQVEERRHLRVVEGIDA